MTTETKTWIGIAVALFAVYWLFLRPNSESSVPDSLPMLTDASFDSEIAEGDIVVDFYADWCGPCRIQKKILVGLSESNPSFKIAKVNVDDTPGLARKFAVTSIPRLIAFRNGKIIKSHVGVADESEIRAMFAQ